MIENHGPENHGPENHSPQDLGPQDLGLRAWKRLAARAALSDAAGLLLRERGWAALRVPDIARAAGVSPRTFNNYFASKEEAVLATVADRGPRLAAALAARPADEPLWGAVTEAVVEVFAPSDRVERETVERMRTVMAVPELHTEYLRAHAVLEQHLAEAVARRSELADAPRWYPPLIASVVLAAARTGIDGWLAQKLTGSLADALRTVLEHAAPIPPGPPSLAGPPSPPGPAG